MMHHYVWMITSPELQDHLRRANEERAAAIYGSFRGTGMMISWGFRSIVGALRRAQRRGRTMEELSSLSDHILEDIGLARQEIGVITKMAAEADPATKLTIAALRRPEVGDTGDVTRFAPRMRRQAGPETGGATATECGMIAATPRGR